MEPRLAASFWLETCGDDLRPRPALAGTVDCDVAVVGAGYTGLWAAHHLLRLDPTLRVTVLEREIAGWGASGRNGGWCSALFATPWDRVAREHGDDGALRLRRALEATVDDVGAWCRAHGVDAQYTKGGTLTLARNPAQATRISADVTADRRHGGVDTVWLDAAEATRRIGASDVFGAAFTPHCAAVHPARLVRGLARVVVDQGARLYEQTTVTRTSPGQVTTTAGVVRAPVVIRATEAYTRSLAGEARSLVPLWSLVVATDPLPDRTWAELGWAQRETITDGRHLLVYAQRTADDRIVLGGRGAPYRFASGTAGSRGHGATFARLERELRRLFPAARDARVSHRWGGVLGVPRDWAPSVGYDEATGFGWAGGYVGDGVGCSALAGATLADLVLGRASTRVSLPWVGHRSRRWEPEPLRWVGIRGMTALMAAADGMERRTGRPSRLGAALDRLVA